MIHVITSANRHLYEPELLTHFRLRHEVYVVERNWKELDHADGLERDQFDNQDATYIMAIDNGEIVGGSRLIPTTNPHLLSEVFPYLASVRGLPRAADTYEWTRMFVIKSRREGRTMGGQTRGMVICGVLEHCLDNGITGLTALVEMFWLPLFHAMGWKLIPLGLPELISGEWSVAVKMPIDEATLESTRAFHGIGGRAVAPQSASPTVTAA
ncbi:MAG: acyl-homoserine-lactone synthase [Xanthobacteraceae bacterium]